MLTADPFAKKKRKATFYKLSLPNFHTNEIFWDKM